MKNNLKSWGLQFARLLQKKPSSWIIGTALLFLPNPTLPTPKQIQVPFLRTASVKLQKISLYPAHAGVQAPATSAKGIYIVDIDSMVPLLTKNPNEQLRPASTTKIMTALVALDTFGSTDTITSLHDNAVGKTIKLKNGEQLAFSDLLYALLLESGNDAALTVGENYPGGYTTMVQKMNEKAKALGMISTTYQNVSGLDQQDHITTVHDLAILTAEALKRPAFRMVVGTKEKEIASLDGAGTHNLKSTNELLGVVDGVLGVKTGTTELAGECLVTYVERDGHRVVFVVLGSNNRYGETKQLIDWVFKNHEWTPVQPMNSNKYQ